MYVFYVSIFFFKQKTAYEMRISDWSSDVCSSDLQNSSPVTGTQIGGGLSRQPGSSASSGSGSITAPDRMCAPIVLDFSITHTDSSGLSCLRRIASDSPAGPAPTVPLLYSMTSRSTSGAPSCGCSLGSLMSAAWFACRACRGFVPGEPNHGED